MNTPKTMLTLSDAPQVIRGRPSTPALQRFYSYVQITPTCWLWTGTFYTHLGKPTYGQFWLEGKRTGAHRASYRLHVGPIPAGLDVMHSCDNPPCVNPAHLSPGTRKQNLADARRRNGNWSLRGEHHGRAKLTEADVDTIRAELAKGVYQRVLAERFGVTQAQISNIARGTRWATRPETAEAAA